MTDEIIPINPLDPPEPIPWENEAEYTRAMGEVHGYIEYLRGRTRFIENLAGAIEEYGSTAGMIAQAIAAGVGAFTAFGLKESVGHNAPAASEAIELSFVESFGLHSQGLALTFSMASQIATKRRRFNENTQKLIEKAAKDVDGAHQAYLQDIEKADQHVNMAVLTLGDVHGETEQERAAYLEKRVQGIAHLYAIDVAKAAEKYVQAADTYREFLMGLRVW